MEHRHSRKIANLERLLRPKSIAVIGGLEAQRVVEQCRKIGFGGEIWPVNRRRADVAGIPCVQKIEELPGVPDAAFVAIPPDATVEAVEALRKAGVGGAVCYASGFKEVGGIGVERQTALLDAAGDMAVIGPNCYGVLNYLDGAALWPDQQGGQRVERGAAVVAQSGNISISMTMQERSVPLAYVISVGNKADLGFEDYVEALSRDPRVTCIGLIAENIDNPVAFAQAVRQAKQAGKPVVVLKAGTSAKGAQATFTHTSSLAGSDRLYDAYFDRIGVARVPSLTVLMESLKLLSVFPPLAANRLVSMSCSGGEAALMADLAEKYGFDFPDFDAATDKALNDVLGDRVAVANPLDYHTYIWEDEQALTGCFTAALSADVDAGILVLDYPHPEKCDLTAWEPATRAIISAAETTGTATVVVSSLPENFPRADRDRLLDAGIVPLQGLEEAMQALRAALDAGRVSEAAVSHAPGAGPGSLRTLDEWRSKKLVTQFGLALPQASLVTSATEAVAAAEAIGYPVVAKAVSADLAHKTEAGAVKVNLADADALDAACATLFSLSETVLVEAMVRGAVAEVLIGVNRDAQFGLHLVVGAGGELVEVLDDAAIVLLPASRADVLAALSSLKIYRLLSGYRGRAKGDVEALLDAVEGVARLVEDHAGTLAELDINPLMVMPEGQSVFAADALVRLADEE